MISLRHADISLDLDELQGGRATAWKVADHELLGYNSTHEIEYGMYPMAPWAGRISGNEVSRDGRSYPQPINFAPWAIHGLVLTEPFAVVEREPHHVVLQREFSSTWPWSGGVRCAWTLDDDGLTTEVTCYSRSEDFPAVLGWHPWFRRAIDGVQASWTTDCNEMLIRGDDSLPTGERCTVDLDHGPFDDVLTGGRTASIEWQGILRIEIENSQPWFVVFDELSEFICIEPQTGPADGLSDRHAPITFVTPEQPLVMRTQWRFIRGPQANSV